MSVRTLASMWFALMADVCHAGEQVCTRVSRSLA